LQKSAGEMFRAIVSSNTGLYTSIGADGNGGWINGSTNLFFQTGGTERMRLDSSGNLLLGTTALNRLGSGASGPAVHLAGSAGVEMYLSTTSTTSGDFVGAINFGTTGTSSAAKRSAIIGSLLSATSSSVVSGNLVFYTNSAGTLAERMRILSNGVLKSGISSAQSTSEGGVASWNTVGTIGNDGAVSFDITVPEDNGIGTGHHVEANMTHINFGSYGCLLDTWISTRGTGIQEQQDIKNVTSGNGGSWTVTKPNSTTLRVTKNAGTYPGAGYYWIKVTTVSVI
jgi:hypothetical protein